VLRLWAGLEDELHLPAASDGTAVSAAASAQDAVALADADAGTPAAAPTHTHTHFCSPLNTVIWPEGELMTTELSLL